MSCACLVVPAKWVGLTFFTFALFLLHAVIQSWSRSKDQIHELRTLSEWHRRANTNLSSFSRDLEQVQNRLHFLQQRVESNITRMEAAHEVLQEAMNESRHQQQRAKSRLASLQSRVEHTHNKIEKLDDKFETASNAISEVQSKFVLHGQACSWCWSCGGDYPKQVLELRDLLSHDDQYELSEKCGKGFKKDTVVFLCCGS